MLAGMHIEQLPSRAQDMIRAEPAPGREILLGYWKDLLVTPVPELTERMTGNLAVLRAGRIPYRYVAGDEPPRVRGLADVAAPGCEDHRLPRDRALSPARPARRSSLPAHRPRIAVLMTAA
jgi:hypothetical protein